MRKLSKNQKALVFELLIGAAMAVVLFFALMNIGTYINGTIAGNLITTSTPGNVNHTLNNISGGLSDTVDIMIIASIITVITVPLAAVIAIRRLM